MSGPCVHLHSQILVAFDWLEVRDEKMAGGVLSAVLMSTRVSPEPVRSSVRAGKRTIPNGMPSFSKTLLVD